MMNPSTATVSTAPGQPARGRIDVERIRADFPILHRQVNGRRLVYLDNAATAQKPRSVIEAISRYYETGNANIHRGVHRLSVEATQAYEDTRLKTRDFLRAADTREIIFCRGATEAINLVAQSFARPRLSAGDEILVTTMEHHSNIVPWQILREQTGAVLKVAPINDDGEVIVEEYAKLLSSRTKMVAIAHVSNALGTVNPVKEMVELAHRHGAPVLVDGAQAAPHLRADVRGLDCDFYAVSSHKMFGPTGVGVLYGKVDLLESMRPYQTGGEMISSVTFERTTYNELPHRFEAGTPNIAGVVAFGSAIDYLERLGMDAIAEYEHELLAYGAELLAVIPEVRIIGTAREKASVLSFVIKGIHPHDVGTVLDMEGIAVRTGHHCAQPVMERFGVPATTRASLAFYNTKEELDILAAGIRKVVEVFG
jgi:cysteine desulfurase/selenocysteine lyase